MTSQSTLADGLYTISKNQTTLATLQSVQPGTDIVLLPSSAHEAPDQRVGSISYSHSRIRSYDIFFSRPVGDQENIKGNLHHNKPGNFSVV
jgi:hypothetical protein